MKFWKEFPELSIDYDFALKLAQEVIERKDWNHIRTLKRLENFEYEHSTLDAAHDTDWKKRAEYMKKAVFAYRLTPEEMRRAGVHCESAFLFKTEANTTPYIHREGRSKAINFPLIFEAGKSYVGFYDDHCRELDRHELVRRVPVHFDVSQWHTIHNDSPNTPRIVLTCSGFTGEWSSLLC